MNLVELCAEDDEQREAFERAATRLSAAGSKVREWRLQPDTGRTLTTSTTGRRTHTHKSREREKDTTLNDHSHGVQKGLLHLDAAHFQPRPLFPCTAG